MIKIPDINLQNEKGFDSDSHVFESETMSSHYHKTLDKFGTTVSGSAGYGPFSVSTSYSVEKSKEIAKTKTTTSKYYEKKQVSVNKQIKFKLDESKLRFTDECMEDLRAIYGLFKNKQNSLKHETKLFFDKYGTHINTGYYHFGGIYIFSAVMKGFKETEIDEVKTSVSKSLEVKASGGWGGVTVGGGVKTTNDKGEVTKDENSYSDSRVDTSLMIRGGNQNAETNEKWRDSLEDNNSKLCIIEVEERYVSVAAILLNYRQDPIIDDIFAFALHFNKVWSELTGLKLEDLQNQELIEIKKFNKRIVNLLEVNNKYILSKRFDSFCADLVEFKEEYDSQDKSEFWRRLVLTNTGVKKHLMIILNNYENFESVHPNFKKIFSVFPKKYTADEKKKLSQKLDDFYIDEMDEAKYEKIKTLNELINFLESENMDYNEKKKPKFFRMIFGFLNKASKLEKAFLNLLLILFCDLNSSVIELDQGRIQKLIDYSTDYLDSKNKLITHLKKQAYLFRILFLNKSNNEKNYKKADLLLKTSLLPIEKTILFIIKDDSDIMRIKLDLKKVLKDNYIIPNNNGQKKEVCFKMDDFLDQIFNAFDEETVVSNLHLLKNNLNVLKTEKYLLLQREFKNRNITKTNYIKNVLINIIKKQNSFLEQTVELDFGDEDKLINNIDIVFELYKFADNRLKQILVKNINLCYKAIPLVTLDHKLFLHNLFSLKKEWYEGENVFKKRLPDIKKPKISFMKLSDETTDKAEIINMLFFDEKKIFQRLYEKCIFAKGGIEFQTSTTHKVSNDEMDIELNELFFILNMRGNSEKNLINQDFMMSNSEMLVIFSEITEKKMNKIEYLIKKNKLVIHVILSKENMKMAGDFDKKYPKRYQPIIRKRLDHTAAFIKKEIKKYMPNIKKEDLKSFKELLVKKGIESDLNYNIVRASKNYVNNTMRHLEGDSRGRDTIQRIYEQKIDLEKKIRRQNFEKNNFNIDKKNAQDDLAGLNLQLNNIVGQNSFHKSVKYFIANFLKLNKENVCIYLDMLQNKFTEKMLKAQNENSDNDDEFQLTNYFREMTYLCEFILDKKIQNRDFINDIINKFVDIMLGGHYVELINGVCTGFNSNFFELLFKKLEERLGRKNFFILSTLGLQSSGKSTMLNTMFNVNFNTGMGRCTKGINMQLLKMDPKLVKHNSCEYILILDTEGLRSSEQMKGGIEKDYKRDNELATFITGISDLTILNIMGLNDAALLDILQIVISAFVKIKSRDNINNKWMFLHQNINSPEAEKKKNDQYVNIINSLDQVTQVVSAKYECDFEKFTDLVNFNKDEDIHLISTFQNQFSISKSYVNDTFNVKNKIIDYINNSNGDRLNNIFYKMKGLYDRIMFDDFSFGFKNALFINIYNQIEEVNNIIVEELREEKYAIIKKYDKLIFSYNKPLKGDSDDIKKTKEKLIDKKNTEDKNVLKNIIKKYISNKLIPEEKKLILFVKKKIDNYLSNNSGNKEIYKKYSEDIVKSLNYDISNFIRICKKKIDFKFSQNEITSKFEACLTNAKKLACDKAELKGREIFESKKEYSDEELKKVFNDLIWSVVKNEVIVKGNFQLTELEFNVTNDIKDKLEKHVENNVLNELMINENWIQKGIEQMDLEFKKLKKVSFFKKIKQLFNDDQENLKSFHEETINEVLEKIELKKNKKTYEIILIEEIIKETKEIYKSQKNKYKSKLKLKGKDYLDHLIIYACCKFIPTLEKIISKQKESLNISNKLEEDREQIEQVFINTCRNVSKMQTQIDCITSFFKSNYETFLTNSEYWDDKWENLLLAKFPSKDNLIKAMMKHIIEESNINSIIDFSRNLKNYMRSFLKTQLEEIIKDNKENLISKRKNIYINNITKFMGEWKNYESLKDIMDFYEDNFDYKTIFPSPIINREYELDQKELIKKTKIQVDTYDFDTELDCTYNVSLNTPKEAFIKNNIGCEECCPFCGSICALSHKDHQGNHSSKLHKSGSLSGRYMLNTNLLNQNNCIDSMNDGYVFTKDDGNKCSYKDYQKVYPHWNIITSEIPEFRKYWKYILYNYKAEIMKRYARDGYYKDDYFTADDKRLTKEDALNELE